jgi:DNA-binding MarR family transcriptional regulator
MDNRTIEKFAANAVEESILDTDILHPEISENDKTLSWDGFIEVYKSTDKVKANFDGKVDIQVKGTMSNNHPKIISFSAETADLRNYLNNGGVIYFVVRIHKERTSERKVYYESLTPVKLKQYLTGVKKQKTKTIKLKEFPSDKYERVSIIINFLQNSRNQSSYVNSGFISLEEMHKKGYNYTMPITSYGKKDANPLFSAIVGKEIYAYVSTEGSSALIPVDTPLTIHELNHKIDKKIYVGDKCYYDSYEYKISVEGTSIKIGDSMTLVFGKNETTTVKINMKFSPLLRKATQDMRFIADALNANNFNIDLIPIGLASFKLKIPDFISGIEKRLVLFEKIIDLFIILHVDDDLNIDNLTAEEQKRIEILIKAFADREHIKNIATNTPTSVLDLKISNIVLKLIILKNEDNTYRIQDFFNSSATVSYKDENGNHRITSPYSALSKDDYLCVSNINYDCILESYKKAAIQNPDVYDRVNMDILQMLLAYDEMPNSKLLNVAKDLANWILIEKKQLNKNINTLNYLQTIKRERSFSKDEIRQLSEITEDANASKQEKAGAYLLLGNKMLTEVHFEKLTKKEQDDFKRFPIFIFWNLSEE